MAGITLRTARQVVPMIYAYTTPEIARHNGWTKIGYTEQSVDKRLKQQTHTADVLFHEEWRGNAVYDDGSGEVFTDHDFHAYLRKLNVENDRKNEWFHLDGQQHAAQNGIVAELLPLLGLLDHIVHKEVVVVDRGGL